jgi:protein subunit release factor A
MAKSEFKITYTKGTGPGGQHKNKTETCVVITHIPTGMQEKCEDTRSKIRNEKIAMERLLRRIEDENRRIEDEKKNEFRKEQIKDKKAIRTYNYPRNEVVDHRTGKRANLKKVMDGDLDLLK